MLSCVGLVLASVFNPTGNAGIAEANARVDVWWPGQNATVSGEQPIKGVIQGRAIESYRMFWRVGNEAKHEIHNNYETTPHKESRIDFSGWTWKGNGPYEIIVSAEEFNGTPIGETRVSFFVHASQKTAEPVAAPITASTIAAPVATAVEVKTAPTPAPVVSEKKSADVSSERTMMSAGVMQTAESAPATLAMSGGLYVQPESNASRQAAQWRTSNPTGAALMDILAKGAQSIWLGGWNVDVKADVQKVVAAAKAQGTTPVFVVYNIPHRDCGGYSAGGVGSADAYRTWIRSISDGLGDSRALVVLEPDALTGSNCLPEDGKKERFTLLKEAVTTLNKSGKISVYIDAGHARWLSAEEAAGLLEQVGIASAAGFSLNVSNFIGNDESKMYGEKIANLLSSKVGKTPHFVIDTSRNGQGPGDTWCNPSGRGLGQLPTLSTGQALVDAYLWIKAPGESDGACNGAPQAGAWWPEYAQGLVERRLQ